MARRKKRPDPASRRPQIASDRESGPSRRSRGADRAELLISLPPLSRWPAAYWQVIGAMLLTLVYAYWPTLRWMADSWYNEPDYSHGWVVPLLALAIAYYRVGSFPGVVRGVSWGGLSLIVLAIAMRVVSRFTYTDFLDGWSILPMISGVVWCLLGWPALYWALPALGFLIFMVPMPYRAESMLSWRLQGVATDLSTVFLRVLGQPAVADGHTVWIGDEQLVVEQACSGLRIFVGMAAFSVYWAAVNLRGWSDKLVILAAAIPAAVLVNALRITAIGLGYSWFSSEGAHQLIHDLSGILMIFASFALMGAVSWYWQKLYAPVRKLTARELLRESRPLVDRTEGTPEGGV